MSIQRIVRRLLLGPYAVIWMLLLTQLLWHIYSGSFLDRLYSFNAHGFAVFISAARRPTQDIAEIGGTALSTLILSVATFRMTTSFDLRGYIETYGCTLHEQIHHGPGLDTTYEVWASGKKCKTRMKHTMVFAKWLDKHLLTITKTTCHRLCISSLSPGNSQWRNYLTTAPAYSIPGTTYCNGPAAGRCVEQSQEEHSSKIGQRHTTVLSL